MLYMLRPLIALNLGVKPLCPPMVSSACSGCSVGPYPNIDIAESLDTSTVIIGLGGRWTLLLWTDTDFRGHHVFYMYIPHQLQQVKTHVWYFPLSTVQIFYLWFIKIIIWVEYLMRTHCRRDTASTSKPSVASTSNYLNQSCSTTRNKLPIPVP